MTTQEWGRDYLQGFGQGARSVTRAREAGRILLPRTKAVWSPALLGFKAAVLAAWGGIPPTAAQVVDAAYRTAAWIRA